MDSKLVATAIGVSVAAGIVVAIVTGGGSKPGAAVPVLVPEHCHSYEEQKSDACRAFWNRRPDAGPDDREWGSE